MSNEMQTMMKFAHIFAKNQKDKFGGDYQAAFKAGMELTWQRHKAAHKDQEWFEAHKGNKFGPLGN